MNKRKYFIFVFLVILSSIILTACGNNKKEDKGNVICYLNLTHDGIVTRNYSITGKKTEDIIKELFTNMKRVPDDTITKLVPDNVILNAFYIENGILFMDFSKGYNDMNTVDETLFKAGLVKTMTQIPGVENVYFYVEGQPVTDINGIDIGPMNNLSFITEFDSDDSIIELSTILYFSDSTGNALEGERTNIKYNKSTSIEKVIIDYLINGPEDKNKKRTLPSKLNVISASTKDGVCYVNFDTGILSSIADVSVKVTLYSIVNSLCELPSVKRVQFLVNGSSNYTLRETYSFKDTYERNLDFIKKEE